MEFSETRDPMGFDVFLSARCNGFLWDYRGITMNLNGISPTKMSVMGVTPTRIG